MLRAAGADIGLRASGKTAYDLAVKGGADASVLALLKPTKAEAEAAARVAAAEEERPAVELATAPIVGPAESQGSAPA